MITILYFSDFCFVSLLPFSISLTCENHSIFLLYSVFLLNTSVARYARCFSLTPSGSVTPAGCALIWLNPDLPAWIASDSTGEGCSPTKPPPPLPPPLQTPSASPGCLCASNWLAVSWRILWPHPLQMWLICQSHLQNLEKLFTCQITGLLQKLLMDMNE